MGLVKVLLWYSGVTTGVQSARASGSPCTARVEKPRRRFTAGPGERQRDGPPRGARGEPPRPEPLGERRGPLGGAQGAGRAVGPLDPHPPAAAPPRRLHPP